MTLPDINPTGVGTAWIIPSDHLAGSGVDVIFGASPGSTNAPIIFEPGSDLTNCAPLVYVLASGGVNWGGAQVHASLDGTTYGQIGTVVSGAAQGLLTNTFPSGSDPDMVNTLSVNLTMSRGQLLAGTSADADHRLPTLAYCDGELIAFSVVTLTSAYNYDLDTYIRRRCYDTTIASHASGTQFGWVQNPFTYEYPRSLVGTTVYFKLPAFNKLGAELQDLSVCVAYPYTLTGAGLCPVASTSGGGLTLPLVTGDLPGPTPIADGRGSYIGVPMSR